MFSELTNFDRKQIELLKPFVDRNVVLHFPFFANTFSLAFHYSTALQEKYNYDWDNVRESVIEHDWDEPIPTLVDKKENIFYATLAAIKTAKHDNKYVKWSFKYRPISRYRPLYIFSEYRPYLDSVLEENRNKLMFSNEIIDISDNCGVNRIEVFTDIPTQANVIKNNLCNWGFNKDNIFILKEPIDAIRYYQASKKILRLFYYGAPTTARMLMENYRYISFRLSESEEECIDESMITCICQAKAHELTSCDTDNDFDILLDYHNSIFETAKNESRHESRHIDFINILWAYNRFAERKQHSATFADTQAFANCLNDHHKSPPSSFE